jgi:hypothetical protein
LGIDISTLKTIFLVDFKRVYVLMPHNPLGEIEEARKELAIGTELQAWHIFKEPMQESTDFLSSSPFQP